MSYQDDFTLSAALLEQLSTQGLGALPDLFQVLLNAVMQIERQQHLGAALHERTEERTGERRHTRYHLSATLRPTRRAMVDAGGQIVIAAPTSEADRLIT